MIDAAVRAMAEEESEYVTLGLSPLSRRAMISQKENPLWLRWLLSWAQAHGRRFTILMDWTRLKRNPAGALGACLRDLQCSTLFSPRSLCDSRSIYKGVLIKTVARAMPKAEKTEVGWFAYQFQII